MTETVSYIQNSLKEMYPSGEIKSFTRLIMEQICGLQPYQLLACKGKELSDMEKKRIQDIVARLKLSEPIQYILGQASFYGSVFETNPSVLIPRPETEELVDLIIKDYKHKTARILDIGTGSGCIAVSLAKHLPGAEVVAIDISEEALAVALRNAGRNQTDVSFIRTDILGAACLEDIPGEFDVVVSNPPYVKESERNAMQDNVLRYEPPTALFVPDTDPLLFYKAIAEFGNKRLKKNGRLYVEINAQCGKETTALFKACQYRAIELIRDLSGKDRIIKAEK